MVTKMSQLENEKLQTPEVVIESEASINLTLRESLRLLEIIENPPPRNARFLQAQARYNAETGSAHVTPADGNVFADLGFEPEEAAALFAESQRIISEKRALQDRQEQQ